MTREEKHEFWSHVLELRQASSLTLVEFCRREGIKEHQFHYWRKKIGPETITACKADDFVALKFSEDGHDPGGDGCGISIVLGPVRLELSRGYDSTELLRTVHLLGAG